MSSTPSSLEVAQTTSSGEPGTSDVSVEGVQDEKKHTLVEGPIDSAESTFEPAPHSSSVRDLTIIDCRRSSNALFKLITSAKPLRSLTYTYFGEDTGVTII